MGEFESCALTVKIVHQLDILSDIICSVVVKLIIRSDPAVETSEHAPSARGTCFSSRILPFVPTRSLFSAFWEFGLVRIKRECTDIDQTASCKVYRECHLHRLYVSVEKDLEAVLEGRRKGYKIVGGTILEIALESHSVDSFLDGDAHRGIICGKKVSSDVFAVSCHECNRSDSVRYDLELHERSEVLEAELVGSRICDRRQGRRVV